MPKRNLFGADIFPLDTWKRSGRQGESGVGQTPTTTKSCNVEPQAVRLPCRKAQRSKIRLVSSTSQPFLYLVRMCTYVRMSMCSHAPCCRKGINHLDVAETKKKSPSHCADSEMAQPPWQEGGGLGQETTNQSVETCEAPSVILDWAFL